MPYSKRTHTFRAAVGNHPAARARLGSESFVGLNVNSPAPAGLVPELIAQHRPTRVQDGFRHLSLCELSGADIAYDDQGVFPRNAGRRLVNLMLARVGNLGMDRLDTTLVPGSLLDGQRGLVLAVMMQCRDGRSVAACGERLQAKVDADGAISCRQIVGNFRLKDDIPAAASILSETPRLENLRHLTRFPKPETTLKIRHLRAVNLRGAGDEGHPSKGSFRTKARAEMRTALVLIARCGKLPADGAHGVGMYAKNHTGSGTEIDQIESGQPPCVQSGAPSALGFTLGGNTKIPDLIACDRVPAEMFAGRGVFNAEFEA